MLETFRKYTGLMFVVLILLFVGLVFFGSSQQSLGSGPKVVKAYGRGYTQAEYRRMAEQPARMLRELANSGGFGPRYQLVDPYLRRMGVVTYAGYPLNQEQLNNYLVNRITLQRAMKEFGVAASTAEVEQYLKEKVFWENGEFNENAYREFAEDSLNPLGMTVKDMNEVIGEVISLEKLEQILGSGVEVSREVVTATYLAGSQRVSYQLLNFPLSQFEEGFDPSEEDIKSHWEEHKASYLSKPKRRLTYILARPDYQALEKKKKEERGAKEIEENQDEDPAADKPDAEKDEDETAAPSDTSLTPEERNRAVIDLGAKLDELDDRLRDNEGKGLEELVKDPNFGFELKTTELVEKEGLPAELTGALRDEPGKTGADVIFEHIPGEVLLDSFGEIKRIGSDQWLLFRLDEVIEPKELSYEDAREQARRDVINEGAAEAMTKAAEEKRKALEEALASGKKFEDAAKELELTPIPKRDLPRPAGREATADATEFTLATKTNPGNLSEVFTEDNEEEGLKRSLFLFVEKREVYEDPNLESLLDTRLNTVRERNRGMVIDNLFALGAARADFQVLSP